MSTSTTRSHVRLRRVRARCSSSTPRRASRRRRSQTRISRWSTTLKFAPCINKIDLPAADPEARQAGDRGHYRPSPPSDAPEISAKQGINIDAVLEDIVQNLPCPQGDPNAPLQALIFDSYYDAYRGVIVYMRLKHGHDQARHGGQDDGDGRNIQGARSAA